MSKLFDNLKKYDDLKNDDSFSEKIGLFIKEDSVSSDIRLLTIFDILSENKQYSVYIIGKDDLLSVENDLLKDTFLFDYVVVQRNALDQNNDVVSNLFQLLVEKCKINDIKIFFEIDDDLINMDKSNPGYGYYNNLKKDMEFLIKNSDAVTVSTIALKDTLSYLNDDIIVIPNRLIDSWFSPKVNSNNKPNNIIKIGYMGTTFHSWDLVLIKDAIVNVKEYFRKKNKEVVFELIGGTDEDLEWAKKISIPHENVRYLNFVEWFKNTVDWDIVVAPLEDSSLNHNKSELKYLEYTALGVPGIYSNIGPYKENIVHEKNGLLVKSNSTSEWEENIIRLIEDVSLQETILNNAKKDVMENYLISYSVNQWEDLLYANQRDLYSDHNVHKINYNVVSNFKKKYLLNHQNIKILEVGLINKKGNFNINPIFDNPTWIFETLDMEKNVNIDIFCKNIYDFFEIGNNSYDVVICTEFLEQLDYFWLTMIQLERILKPGGFILINSSNSEDNILNNPFVILGDGLESLVNFVNLDIKESFKKEFGGFYNNYVIAQKKFNFDEEDLHIRIDNLDYKFNMIMEKINK